MTNRFGREIDEDATMTNLTAERETLDRWSQRPELKWTEEMRVAFAAERAAELVASDAWQALSAVRREGWTSDPCTAEEHYRREDAAKAAYAAAEAALAAARVAAEAAANR